MDSTSALFRALTLHGGVCTSHELGHLLLIPHSDAEALAQQMVSERLLRTHRIQHYPNTPMYQVTRTGALLGVGSRHHAARPDIASQNLASGFVRMYAHANAHKHITFAKDADEGWRILLGKERPIPSPDTKASVEFVLEGPNKLLLHTINPEAGLGAQIGQRLALWHSYDIGLRHVFIVPAREVNFVAEKLSTASAPFVPIPIASLDTFLQSGLAHALAHGSLWQPNADELFHRAAALDVVTWPGSPIEVHKHINNLHNLLLSNSSDEIAIRSAFRRLRLSPAWETYIGDVTVINRRINALKSAAPTTSTMLTRYRETCLAIYEKQAKSAPIETPEWSRDRIPAQAFDQSNLQLKGLEAACNSQFVILFHTHYEEVQP